MAHSLWQGDGAVWYTMCGRVKVLCGTVCGRVKVSCGTQF